MAEEASGKSLDVVLLRGVTPTGDREVLRIREDRLEVGAVRPLEEGRAITGEVVRLKPRDGCPSVCDVEVLVPERSTVPTARSQGGPPQVATNRYRENWDTIFGARPKQPTLYN